MYSLMITPLPEKLRKREIFNYCMSFVLFSQFCVRLRIRALIRFISVMQSIAACWSICLSRIASSYKMQQAVVAPITCTWSTNTSSGALFSTSSLVMTLCPVSIPDSFPSYGRVGLKIGAPCFAIPEQAKQLFCHAIGLGIDPSGIAKL
jgi:hypothetical protein